MANLLLYNAVNQGIFSKAEDNPVNLGLFSISAFAKEKGYSVKLLKNIKFIDIDKDLKHDLKDALLVGVSCMTGDPIKNAIQFSKTLKKIAPELKIVWGGYHASLEPDQTLSNSYIDFLIRGWGEEPIVELLNAIKHNRDYTNIKGLSYKQDGKIIHNPTARYDDIGKFPMYDYKLLDGFKEQVKGRGFIYCSSRGCPFNCSFCSVAAFYEGNKPYYSYSLERIFDELQYFQKEFKPSHFFLWDDNFFVDKKRVHDFCEIYKQKKCDFKWESFGRCDFFSNCDESLLALLKEVNLKKIYFGAESGSLAVLKKINKNITPAQILSSLERIKKYGIIGDYTFMSGFPFESLADLKETLKLMKDLQGIDSSAGIRIFNFSPSPKMDLIKDCLKAGFKYPVKIEEWEKFEYHCFVPNWVSPEHARLLKVLPWLTSFLSQETLPYKEKRGIVDFVLKILHKSSKFRFKHDFYLFPVEWLALRFFYKKHLGI
ncbi:MAG: radical SAM protein [Candidatus Omnitrophica bacterium]|nr:radical SAM protein [Candidatus Omnitrophota bacterium]